MTKLTTTLKNEAAEKAVANGSIPGAPFQWTNVERVINGRTVRCSIHPGHMGKNKLFSQFGDVRFYVDGNRISMPKFDAMFA